MSVPNKFITLLPYLRSKQLLTHADIKTINKQFCQQSQPLIAFLAQHYPTTTNAIATFFSQYYGFRYVDLSQLKQSSFALKLLPQQLIQQRLVLPWYQQNKLLYVIVYDPSADNILRLISFVTGLRIIPCVADYQQLIITIIALFSNLQATQIDDEQMAVQFIDTILQQAVLKCASDIHFEPAEQHYRIRLRIDGILYTFHELTNQWHNRITVRLKMLANLDIAEKRLAQDGQFNMITLGKSMDIRLSTCPTLYGEKIVLRLLDPLSVITEIEQLGFDTQQQRIFLQAIQQPQGLIVVTGPTGSGKTVTLYTALNQLNSTTKNIATVEDPVEIKLAGINQVNVHPSIGRSFAQVLRTFLRQDPDIMMVGEIRDQETATICIRAAQTGHLVLSTLHTNSAIETIGRLLNLTIPTHQLASSLKLIIAQRLLRKLCNKCKQPYALTSSIAKQLGITELNITLYQANHCQSCQAGYQGRIGIYECLPITDAMQMQLMQQTAIPELKQNINVQTLRQSAIKKVLAGVTSVAEMQRVLG